MVISSVSCQEQLANAGAHSLHSFGNCASCDMSRIVKGVESSDIRSHVFAALLTLF